MAVHGTRLWLGRLALGLVGTLLALGLAETVLRVIPATYLRLRATEVPPLEGGDSLLYVVGDSVPYGYGIDPADAWPAQLAARISALGPPGVKVQNAALPGSNVERILTDQLGGLYVLPASVRPVVLIQTGHNDLFSQPQAASTTGTPAPAHDASLRGFALLRLLDRPREVARRERPSEVLPEQARNAWAGRINQICAPALRVGGHCYLLTYVVPGPIEEDLRRVWTVRINSLRQAQLEANRLVRWAGEQTGLPVIDLARLVEVPPQWSGEDWVDAVHPKARIHAEIAEAIHQSLYPHTDRRG